MTKKLAILLLLVAFLVSAWGNVIAASFCPSYLARNCLLKLVDKAKAVNESSCQHETADMNTTEMQMDDMQMDESAPETELTTARDAFPVADVTDSSSDQSALETPREPCSHCWMHSQPPSGTGTLAAVDPSPRSVAALAPPAETTIDLGFPNPAAIEPIEHSPPGSSSPRHILINVFRI